MSSNGCSRTGETCEIRNFRLQALHLATRITVPNHWRCCWGCAEGRAVLGQCWEPWDLRNLGKILRHVAVQPTLNIGGPSSCVSAWRKYVDARSRTAGVLDVPLRPFVYILCKKKKVFFVFPLISEMYCFDFDSDDVIASHACHWIGYTEFGILVKSRDL